MEHSYLNLFDCDVLNENPLSGAPWGRVAECGFICIRINLVKCTNQKDMLNKLNTEGKVFCSGVFNETERLIIHHSSQKNK